MIQKGGSSKKVSNVRPISLLPSPGKVLESLLCQRMMNYLHLNNLICREQSGCRKHHGTFDPLAELIKFVNSNFNEGKLVLCIFVDLAKAFNSLNCDILSKKLLRLSFVGKFK